MQVTIRILRTALAVVGTCAVLAGGAWSGGAFRLAHAQAGPRTGGGEPGAPRAHDLGGIPVGDALVANGQSIQLSVSYTADPPAQVAEFYADAFRKRGLLPIASGDERLGHVSVIDPEDGLQRSVTALFEPSGHTLVLLAVTDPRQAPRLMARVARAPYPVPEDHRAFLGHESEDGGARAHGGQFVTRLTVAQVANFYRERLTAQGYAERPAESGDGLLVFAKSGSTISVALQALEHRRGAAVFVSQTDRAP